MSSGDKQVPSPCIRNCCLDDQDICLGCFRSMEEILQWGDASDQRRQEILVKIEQRKRDQFSANL